MNISADIPEDELLLARLICSKLGRRLEGIISVGLAALELPSPVGFFAGRDRVIAVLIEVLRCTVVKPGSDEAFALLLDHIDRLTLLWKQFYEDFTNLAHWQNMPSEKLKITVDDLFRTHSTLFQTLESLAEMIDMKSGFMEKKQRTCKILQGWLREKMGMEVQSDAKTDTSDPEKKRGRD